MNVVYPCATLLRYRRQGLKRSLCSQAIQLRREGLAVQSVIARNAAEMEEEDDRGPGSLRFCALYCW